MRWLAATFCLTTAAGAVNGEPPCFAALLAGGGYADAEQALLEQIADPLAPITEPAAIQLEILRRTRLDFSLSREATLAELRESVPDATREEFDAWNASGDLQSRVIDGELRYFKKGVRNLFLINDEARRRRAAFRAPKSASPDRFNLTDHVRGLVAAADDSEAALISPIKHRVAYELSVVPDHPRVQPGAKVAVWLPYPQVYGQQGDVRLVASEPEHQTVAPNGSPHRTIYFEQVIGPDAEPPTFRVEYEFVTHASCTALDPGLAEPYDTTSEVYTRYTAERAPHIVFNSEVRSLAADIVGDETNPLEKVRCVFRWVSQNIPWIGEMEYAIIPSLSAKGLAARRGDCGVQGMTFITLCRAAGVPARWQSGWQTKPGRENMHDWSEVYIEPWGWLPADASYGQLDDPDPRVRDFFCGRMDPYRMIVNLDYARDLTPSKKSFRSEPNDFQRGEIEIDGHNLYFNEWRYRIEVETEPAE
ncbi:MAG: transglutaminase-like domain-containing protein [Planctomycetota bacterium]